MNGYYKHRIYLNENEVKKVSEFFEKELGITDIMTIDATPKEFVIETYLRKQPKNEYDSEQLARVRELLEHCVVIE